MALNETLLLRPLAAWLQVVPDAVHGALFTRLVNHLAKGQVDPERLEPLHGKRFALVLTDTGNTWTFSIHDGRLLQDTSAMPADVRIAGRVVDFLLLATRAEDPDTLFFSRRLSLQGDTATGLYVKNLLDAIELDWTAHFDAVLGPRPARAMAGLLSKTPFSHLIASVTEKAREKLIDTAAAAAKPV